MPYTSTDPSSWKRHTDASLRLLVEKLRIAHRDLKDGVYKELATIHGYSHNPWNIIADAKLEYRAASTILFDWMHVWCVDGVWQRSLSSLMDSIKEKSKRGRRPDLPTSIDINSYLQVWSWPGQVHPARRVCEGESFSGTASETLSAIPVLSKFFRDVVMPMGGCDAEIQSFFLACDVVERVNAMVRKVGTPRELLTATKAFLHSHLNAHGEYNWVLKFHLALHLPEMWAALPRCDWDDPDCALPSCWSLERKHRFAKKHMQDNRKGQSYERSVVEEVTLDHFHHWSKVRTRGMTSLHKPSKWVAMQLADEFGTDEVIEISNG